MSRSVSQKIVAAAASVYLLERAIALSEKLSVAIVTDSLHKIDILRKNARTEIYPSFDLWWEETAMKKILETIDASRHAGWAHQEPATIALLREQAWYLAARAYMSEGEEKIIGRLPKIGGMRHRMMATHHDVHDGRMREASNQLSHFGIDPAELRAHFAPAD